MSIEQEQRAAEVVIAARRGDLGQDGVDLVALFSEATRKGARETERLTRIEREANALAAVLADIMDGAEIDDVIDDLPHDARRRVIAYRHASSPLGQMGIKPSDQFGKLPRVPPRASVMRDRVSTVDGEVSDDGFRSRDSQAARIIEG